MIERRLKPALDRLLERNPAVVLIGPRQVGKTTLARERDAVYVDLELPSDLAKGFHSACDDLRPARRFVVHGGNESFPLSKDVRAVTVRAMMDLIVQSGSR